MHSPLRILVATDGSPAAGHAVLWSAELARSTGAEVIVVHTMSRVGEWLMSVAQIDFVRMERDRRELLEGTWSQPVRDAGVSCRTVFLTGDPVEALLAIADQEDVDFIVIGKSGHGGVGSLFLGGSASKLTQRTRRPLLVVPAPASP